MKICIDPGHGGSDPGALAGGVREKDLTLAIGTELAEQLKRDGFSVAVTRTGDKYLSLTERCEIANREGADAFVSVHINSASSETAAGIETWYSQGSVKGPKLAKAIQDRVIVAAGAVNRGTKAGKFTVLTETKAPAALIECGFIVNGKERARLVAPEYQRTIAKAIAGGVCDWFGVHVGEEEAEPNATNEKHWAESALDSLVEKGIISQPEKHRGSLDKTFTKGEICAMLDKITK